MAVKVVDASALAAPLFGEPEAEAIAGLLANARLVARDCSSSNLPMFA
jgi:uncharacterized protein with PIN domain